ncbi:phosphoribosylglycinamide formyltransferase [Luteolibacter sp. SL250]|uniref:phosphoribosylglycinamide formyltransferase n=1 Tax=Luteolibacter sp. SL250 TaxID=2995170 RepID=UPI00226D8A03|nr:phosphoribosylglycinamide formyltransferase [Luteolibacter sp. SL250]WAC21296.1 phosphoribosylglycinamide formyltransferase [Luteolibacter sp. SL250]
MKIAILASHGGSNMQAVLDAIACGRLGMEPSIIISNNRKAYALERAAAAGIPHRVLNGTTHPEPADLDQAILAALRESGTDIVLLAGYMKKLGPATLSHFDGRIVNIHPSLLPKFGGQGMYGSRVHEAVLASSETETGVTIHLVDGAYDEGRILAQTPVPVLPEDTVETLAARVLEREHRFLVETLVRVSKGEIPL